MIEFTREEFKKEFGKSPAELFDLTKILKVGYLGIIKRNGMKKSMRVNFNNVRKQAMLAYERLCAKLEESIDQEDNTIHIDPEDIYKEMNDLRMMIGIIAMTYEDGNEDFKDVYEEEYPEPKAMTVFNDPDRLTSSSPE